MRVRSFVLAAGILAFVGMTPAQDPPKADRCDIVLKHWQQAMAGVEALEADCSELLTPRPFGTDEVYEGKYRYLQSPTVCASFDLHQSDDAEKREKAVLNDDGLCFFQYDVKQLSVYDVPKKHRGPGSNPLTLIFNPLGFELTLARAFDGTLFTPSATEPAYTELTLGVRRKEDERMARGKRFVERFRSSLRRRRILLLPATRSSKDKVNFDAARLALLKTTYLPAQIWFRQANSEITWTFTHMNPAAKHLQPADFATPTPAGWKRVMLPLSGVPVAP